MQCFTESVTTVVVAMISVAMATVALTNALLSTFLSVLSSIPVYSSMFVHSQGAGDAFIGALAHYTAMDPTIPLVQRVGAAVHIATYSVQRKGTQSSYPTLRDLGDFDIKTKKFDWSYA